jgi:hypothetical protein
MIFPSLAVGFIKSSFPTVIAIKYSRLLDDMHRQEQGNRRHSSSSETGGASQSLRSDVCYCASSFSSPAFASRSPRNVLVGFLSLFEQIGNKLQGVLSTYTYSTTIILPWSQQGLDRPPVFQSRQTPSLEKKIEADVHEAFFFLFNQLWQEDIVLIK